MAKYLKRIGPTQIITSAATIFTVTAGEQWIVKHFRLTNATNSVNGASISVGTLGSTTQIRNAAQTIPIEGSEDSYMQLAFNSGEIMQALATVSGMLITIDIDRYVVG